MIYMKKSPGNLKDADLEIVLFLHTMRVQLPMMKLLFKDSFEVPKKSVLLYAFKDGERVDIEEDEKVFDTKI